MANKIPGLKVLILPLSLALTVMIAVLYVKPAFTEMQKNKKALDDSRAQLATIQQQMQKLSQIKSGWESLEDKDLILAALPSEKSTEDYIAELYQRVSSSGVLLSGLDAANPLNSLTKAYLCSGAADSSASSAGTTIPSASPVGQASALGSAGTGGAASTVVSPFCASNLIVNLSVTGNWDQLLGLFKYLADTNRVATLDSVTIGNSASNSAVVGTENQGTSDVLNSKITLDIFYMPKKSSSDYASLAALANSNGFNADALKKLKDSIFAAYQEPVVSASGERNLFK